jgi:hypothetical protein
MNLLLTSLFFSTLSADHGELYYTLKDIISLWSPAFGLIVAAIALTGVLVTAFKGRKTGKETNEISEKDANTRATEQLTEMFTAGLAEIRLELEESKKSASKLKVQVEDQQKQIIVASQQQQELIKHILELERLVPTPPGAPPRPEFMNIRTPHE